MNNHLNIILSLGVFSLPASNLNLLYVSNSQILTFCPHLIFHGSLYFFFFNLHIPSASQGVQIESFPLI